MTLKERRIAAGFENASDLARVIGISPSRMWRLESGSQSLDNLDEEHKILLAEFLKCEVDDLDNRITTHLASPCNVIHETPEEIQRQLSKRFGEKLIPIDHSRKNDAPYYFPKEGEKFAMF